MILINFSYYSPYSNQWEILLEYGTSKGVTNPFLVLESAWHKPAWALVKDALAQVEQGCPKEFAWKLHLYRGYLAICNPTEPADTVQQQLQQQIQQPPQFNNVDRYVDIGKTHALKKYDQFALNTSWFYPRCAISRNFALTTKIN